MKIEARILLILGLFFAVMGVVYWVWSGENAGGMMIVAGGLLGFFPGSYYYWWSRRIPTRPEDDENATMESGAGHVDAFPGSSIFPFTLGAGAFFVVLSLVFGVWLLVPGLSLVIWAMIGGVAEGRRGGSH